ncbi:MAG: hypothetical protein LBG78_01645 [Azoarcus sp.]|jgi:hypothetical protein|nr:hypothetical protein [Azoarcus sp.]
MIIADNSLFLSGKMTNRALRPREKIFRVFGEPGTAHLKRVGEAKAGGKWWGISGQTNSGKAWREECAVLDEWNRDGFIGEGILPGKPDEAAPKTNIGTYTK